MNLKRFSATHACILCSFLILLLSVQSAFAEPSRLPERRRPQFENVSGWIIVPYVFDYPGLGKGYGVLGGAANISGTYTDVAGSIFAGDVSGEALGISSIHLVPQKLILDTGVIHVSNATLQSYSRRGMAAEKNDYTLLEFVNSSFYGGRLLATFFERRFEVYAGLYGGSAQFQSVREPDGNVIIEAQNAARSRPTTMVFGMQLDATDDYVDPRRGLRFSVSNWRTPAQDLGPDFFYMDYSATAYIPLWGHSTWALNYLRSDAYVLRQGETDYDVIARNQGLDCSTSTDPQRCEQVISNIIAANTYGTATSLGGLSRLRSYPEGRFKGAHTEFFGTEVRWNLTEENKPFNIVIVKDVRVAFQIALFYEIGTTADRRSELWDITRSSCGVGVRMVVASGLVYRVDFATGNEGFQTSIFFQYPW